MDYNNPKKYQQRHEPEEMVPRGTVHNILGYQKTDNRSIEQALLKAGRGRVQVYPRPPLHVILSPYRGISLCADLTR